MSTLVQLIPVTAGKRYLALYDDGELYCLELDLRAYTCTVRPIRMETRPPDAD
jgi:hypothetical protein